MTSRPAVSSPLPNDPSQKGVQDQNQDANAALMELEKGLRSNKAGEQCEAIVNLPSLLQRFPYPILVNSAFLKLADVFRTGTSYTIHQLWKQLLFFNSNFMKLCVLKAIQSSKRHLEKIFNIDEFCRRFFAVIHSNDPVARAVTLRVFGNISSIIAERKNIHHSIRNSLDSHDAVEVEAAIYATKCFAEQSSTFASGIWPKVAEMIQGLSTPVDMKLRLLSVLKFMCHEFTTASQVMKLFKELLSSYPAHEFVCTILNTSTQLAISTLISSNQQVDLLLEYLKDDPRKSVKLVTVRNLSVLARKAPHLWNARQVSTLLLCVPTLFANLLKEQVLQVAVLLSKCLNAKELFHQDALDILEELTSDMNIEIASLALETRVLVISTKPDMDDIEIVTTLEGDVEMLLAMCLAEESKPALKRCLHAGEVLLSKRSSGQSTLVLFIVECLETLSGTYLLEALHTLVTVATHKHGICCGHVDTLIKLFKTKVNYNKENEDKKILVALLTLIFQSSSTATPKKKNDLQETLLQCVATLTADDDLWTVFKMARQASIQVYPLFATKCFTLLSAKVSSEHFYFWLKALGDFHNGETAVMTNVESVAQLQDQLMLAQNYYQQGLTHLKASVTTDHPLYFQYKYARLRSDTLRAYSQLLTCCASMKLNPPPTNARSTALMTGQELHHLSRLGIQFHNCALLFNTVASGYQNLFRSSFNSDTTSLHNIQILQESTQLISYAIETLVTQRVGERVSAECSTLFDVKSLNGYLQKMTDNNLSLLETIKSVDAETKDSPLSHKQIDCLQSFILSQLNVGYCFPTYFFKSLQNTVLQLSISPCNNRPDEAYLVNHAHDMSLKIEGVVVEKTKAASFRHVSKVNIAVKVKPTENVRNPIKEIKPVQATEMVFQESTTVLHDYFNSSFILTFKYIGQHIVRINCGVTDEHGIDWDTGPSYTMYVEVYEQAQGHVKRR